MQVRSYRAYHYSLDSNACRQRVLLAALAALLASLLLVAHYGGAGGPVYAAPSIPQALTCVGPCVGITNPLYQNGAVAEGPVGTHLTVQGAGWPANTTLMVWPVANATPCAEQADDAGSIPVDAAGNALGIYDWPADASAVNQAYMLCGKDGAVVSLVPANAPDTFTVLAAAAPAITVTPVGITQGGAVEVSGQNWLPAQTVTISICTNFSAGSVCASRIIAGTSIDSAQEGSFQVTLNTDPAAPPGSYYVIATAHNNALTAPPAGSDPQLTVSTPTPTPTITPTPTVAPTPTATPTPSGGSGGNALLIALLGMLSMLFLIGGIISLAVYLRGNG